MIRTTCITLLFLLLYSCPLFGLEVSENREHQYTPCDVSKYPDNMTMVVQVKADGVLLGDCEVAVLDASGECRESSFSMVEHEGRCYLTIQGEGTGEQLTFRVVYTIDGKQLDVAAYEQVAFEVDASLGSYAAPYVLTIPAISAIEQDVTTQRCVRPICGGLMLTTTKVHTFKITSLSGLKYERTVLGSAFVPCPPGVYIVDGRLFSVK